MNITLPSFLGMMSMGSCISTDLLELELLFPLDAKDICGKSPDLF